MLVPRQRLLAGPQPLRRPPRSARPRSPRTCSRRRAQARPCETAFSASGCERWRLQRRRVSLILLECLSRVGRPLPPFCDKDGLDILTERFVHGQSAPYEAVSDEDGESVRPLGILLKPPSATNITPHPLARPGTASCFLVRMNNSPLVKLYLTGSCKLVADEPSCNRSLSPKPPCATVLAPGSGQTRSASATEWPHPSPRSRHRPDGCHTARPRDSGPVLGRPRRPAGAPPRGPAGRLRLTDHPGAHRE